MFDKMIKSRGSIWTSLLPPPDVQPSSLTSWVVNSCPRENERKGQWLNIAIIMIINFEKLSQESVAVLKHVQDRAVPKIVSLSLISANHPHHFFYLDFVTKVFIALCDVNHIRYKYEIRSNQTNKWTNRFSRNVLHYITLHYRYFIRHLHLKWPVVLQQSYVRQLVYASVNRWVFSCLLKVHVSVSSWRAKGRSFQAFGPA